MSAVARQRFAQRPLRGQAPKRSTHRSLRLVAPVANRARRTPFVVVLLAMIGAGLVGLIVLSTYMQSQAFTLDRLQAQARDLQTQQDALEREVSDLESPRNVGLRAVGYGMVPSQTPVYLRLSDGRVIGRPEAADEKTNFQKVMR